MKPFLLFTKRNAYRIFLLITSLFIAGKGQSQISINALSTAYTQNFDGMGNSATATLPSGFVVSSGSVYSAGTTTTDLAAGSTGTGALSGSSSGGTYNFANGVTASATDRSLGFLTSSGFSSPRSIMLQVTNNTGSTITSLTISFDFEKYRSGTRAFNWTFFHGSDGTNWGSETSGDQSYAADANNTTVYNPPTSISKSFTISDVIIPNGSSYYFRWTFTGVGGSSNGQAIGLDNFSISATSGSYTASNATDYFRSRKSGDWGSYHIWESSLDGSTWHLASIAPTSTANTISIQNGHIVSLASATTADQLTIQSGGTLVHNSGTSFSLNDGTGTDMMVYGTYTIYGDIPTVTSATYSVESGGVVRVLDNLTPGLSDDLAYQTSSCTFRTGSVFLWETGSFPSSGVTYFKPIAEYPVFRVATSSLVGANSATIIYGFLEVNSGITLTIQNSGNRTIRDGFGGNGNINLTGGTILVSGTDLATTRIAGSGTLTLSNTSTNVQLLNASQVSLNSNYVINGSGLTFTVNSGAWLNCGTNVLSGSANFVLASGGRLGIGSAAGITSSGATGNIQTTGRSYNSGADYLYNGSVTQATGGFTTTPTANTVNSLTIANGTTVSLSAGNDGLTTKFLYLYGGTFSIGSGQNLNITNVASGGVYANGGLFTSGAAGGTVTYLTGGNVMIATGSSPRQPNFYNVVINCGVDFNGVAGQSASIANSLQINAGGYTTDAPFYETGSTLIYSTGGTYSRNTEWGSASNQGYPHHVTVRGKTTLNLATNAISPAQLAIGGDLTLGGTSSSSDTGVVNMDSYMGKVLNVGGNLTIGNTISSGSKLNLSLQIGGDLWVGGNFTRYNNNYYNDNSRAIYFKGSANATISTPNVAITPGIPTQYFSYAEIDKNISTNTVTLSCPVGVNNRFRFTKGTVKTDISSLLVFSDNAITSNASDSSFVYGPVRKIGDDAFDFPVGVPLLTGPNGSPVGGYRRIGISAPAVTTDAFTAEYYLANPYSRGNLVAPASPTVMRLSFCEYWRLDRTTGSSNVNVTLTWQPKSQCNAGPYVDNTSYLAIVRSVASGYPFGTGDWNAYGNDAVSGTTSSGSITWNNVSAYGPFTLGTTSQLYNYLPYDLSRFKATGSGRKVNLDWSVAQNDQMDYYSIERSTNGTNFQPLVTVEAYRNRSSASYNRVDLLPVNGWNYYRLKAVDQSGQAYYSDLQKVWMGQAVGIKVSPIPATNVLNLQIPANTFVLNAEVLNTAGQTLMNFRTQGTNTALDITSLAPGTYYLRLVTKDGTITEQFVKQ